MLLKDLKDATILIVDDQEANIELLEGFLADDYTNIKSTTDPRRALPLFDALAPDLILLDLHMPHLDGFAVMEQLQACIPPGAYFPILVLTADISPQVKQRALSEGAKDFLSKPFDPDEVQARIKNLLDTRLLHLQLENRNRVLAQAMRKLDEERELSEQLLLNVLPRSIADRLKREKGTIADRFSEATVLFADIVNFTPVSSRLAPEEVVAWLNDVFSSLDRLAEQHRMEKIKTIGDAIMAAAGVIGRRRILFDLWGDTVNIASRMESHGVEGAIQVTEATYQLLRHHYEFQERGAVEIKGKGVMQTYFLTGKFAGRKRME